MKQIKNFVCALLLGVVCVTRATAAEPMHLEENDFEHKFRGFRNERNDVEKHRRATEMARAYRLTSLQVKVIAQSLRNDDARLEFATAAFPKTLDPENFYEVYDAFTAFSRVMRLHDRVRPMERPAPPVVHLPRILDNDEFADILKSLLGASFDHTRSQLARQILTTSRSLFLSSQVKQIVDLFDFEQNKIETAKLAYEFTFDKEKYYLVNEAFDFENNKAALSSHIESWNRDHPPRR